MLNPKHYRCEQCQMSWPRYHDAISFRVYGGKRKRVVIGGASRHYAETGHKIINPVRGPAV